MERMGRRVRKQHWTFTAKDAKVAKEQPNVVSMISSIFA